MANEDLKARFVKVVEGSVEIAEGKPFGFVDGVFIHPSVVKKFNLKKGQRISGKAISAYQAEKKQWGWRVYEVVKE